MKKNFFPRKDYGIAEELLIILLLKYNKFNVQHMNFKEKNFIEIEEINKIKDFMQINYSYHLNNNENLLITQKNYYGQNYDLLIIQKIDNKINAIFVQIGLDKTKTEIKKIKTDLVENINEYKKGLKAFGFNVDNFYLLFIFDEETQRSLYNKNSGTNICFNNKIDFLVYSFQDFCLKSTINLTDYNKKTLMDIFGMKSLDYLCVVLNLDGSIRGKKEYVARTSAYIEENEPYIQEVQRIFTTDFTADTLKKAVRIITNSFNDLFKLQKDTEEKTSIVQSTPTIIESENNEQEIAEQLELGGEEPNVR